MSIRTRWHQPVSEVVENDYDPFSDDPSEVGVPIDVSGDKAKLHDQLERLVGKEARLANVGVTCAIKDRTDTTCWACPVYRGDDPEAEVGPLCRIGREQEAACTKLAVLSRD